MKVLLCERVLSRGEHRIRNLLRKRFRRENNQCSSNAIPVLLIWGSSRPVIAYLVRKYTSTDIYNSPTTASRWHRILHEEWDADFAVPCGIVGGMARYVEENISVAGPFWN
ncbi:MAG: hypothetical protein LAO30_24605 [Acidobacteriia bacterium]|nr:hypothetical protein [Terriglobia bacterium]